MFLRTTIVLAALLFCGTTALADEIIARNLIISQGCKGCHTLEGSGGNLGPELDKVGSRLTRVQIREKLLEPKTTNPDSLMPDFKHLTEEQLNALLDFLSQLKKK